MASAVLERARRLVVFSRDGGRVLVRLAVSECEVSPRGISVDVNVGPAVIAALFAVLRLAHVTDWRWAAVTAPLWGLVLAAALSCGIAAAVAALRPADGEGGRAG